MENTENKKIILRDKDGSVKDDVQAIGELRSQTGEIALDQSKTIRLALKEYRKKLQLSVARKNKKQNA